MARQIGERRAEADDAINPKAGILQQPAERINREQSLVSQVENPTPPVVEPARQ
jgi:hypothetical protein